MGHKFSITLMMEYEHFNIIAFIRIKDRGLLMQFRYRVPREDNMTSTQVEASKSKIANELLFQIREHLGTTMSDNNGARWMRWRPERMSLAHRIRAFLVKVYTIQ